MIQIKKIKTIVLIITLVIFFFNTDIFRLNNMIMNYYINFIIFYYCLNILLHLNADVSMSLLL